MFACPEGPCTVLIADDVADIRKMMRFWLDGVDDEFEIVAEASNGLEAVEQARLSQPHAVILDLSMPQMDGLEAIPEIRKGSPKSKILVMSGFEAETMSRTALQLGADAYLEKGTGFDRLTEVLRSLCPSPA